jgi:hypothetical protein
MGLYQVQGRWMNWEGGANGGYKGWSRWHGLRLYTTEQAANDSALELGGFGNPYEYRVVPDDPATHDECVFIL